MCAIFIGGRRKAGKKQIRRTKGGIVKSVGERKGIGGIIETATQAGGGLLGGGIGGVGMRRKRRVTVNSLINKLTKMKLQRKILQERLKLAGGFR